MKQATTLKARSVSDALLRAGVVSQSDVERVRTIDRLEADLAAATRELEELAAWAEISAAFKTSTPEDRQAWNIAIGERRAKLDGIRIQLRKMGR